MLILHLTKSRGSPLGGGEDGGDDALAREASLAEERRRRVRAHEQADEADVGGEEGERGEPDGDEGGDAAENAEMELHVKVFDADSWTQDDFLGEARFDLPGAAAAASATAGAACPKIDVRKMAFLLSLIHI